VRPSPLLDGERTRITSLNDEFLNRGETETASSADSREAGTTTACPSGQAVRVSPWRILSGVRVRWIVIAVLTLAAVGVAVRLRSEPVRALRRQAPDLPATMAEHLVQDDDDAFGRFAIGMGFTDFREGYFVLGRSIDYGSPDGYVRTSAALAPYRRRLAVAMTEHYSCPDYLRDLEFTAKLPPKKAIALRIQILEAQRIGRDSSLDTRERIRRYEAALEQFRSFGYTRGIVLTENDLATEVIRLGRSDEHLAHLRRAVVTATDLGETYLKCQYLGSLGVTYQGLGVIDSMHACFDTALTIARRCRFPDQFPRILFFQAGYQIDQGRLAAATEMILEGQRQCREMGGGGLELRFVVDAMDHFADLGCWEIVERLLLRCPVLIRDLEGTSARRPYETYRFAAERNQIGVHLARGRTEEAYALFIQLEGATRRPASTNYGELLDDVTEGLVESGRTVDALPWIEKGLAYCDSFHLPEYGTPLALRLAQAHYSTGSPDSARAALQDFDRRIAPEQNGDLRIARDVLDARLLEREGDRTLARARLDRAMAALRHRARTLDAGPQGYLALSAHQDLREALHGMFASAADGYQFELAWRSLFTELGRGNEAVTTRPARQTRLPIGALHCVYRFGPGAIVRWTATASGISRDTLDMTTADCGREIDTILDALGKGELDPASHVRLHRLAQALLPAQAMRGDSGAAVGTFLITPDGPLTRLPFELLNLSATGFEPLAQRWDVAYGDRPARSRVSPSGSPAILADPLPTAAMRRNVAPAALAEARAEAESVRRAWPGARLFEGAAATKPAVLASWRDASRIHVAAHLMRNPEIPFIAYFPMAQSTPDAPADDGYLEMADIRATDLRGCELVVLSACASGAPYVASGNRLGPSMGDAFLDAGAGAVVQTFWPVADADARRFVERFIATWKPGSDPVAALADARRAALRAGEPPRVWAAWSIHLAGAPWSRPAAPTLTSSLAPVP